MPAPATVRCTTLAMATLLALATATPASSPGTSYIFPAGARRGTTVKVIVGGHYLYEVCPWKMFGRSEEHTSELQSRA